MEAPPEQPLGKNQVSNSTFEEGNVGWTLPPCWSIDAGVAHQGQHSLRFDAGKGCQILPARTQIERGPNARRSYTLHAWVRTSAGSDLQVRLGLHDVKDRSFILGETEFAAPGTEWQEIVRKDIDLLPVHDGDPLEVRAVARGTAGSAWFDDVELVEEDPLPLSVFLLYPNFRGFLWSTGPQTIRAQVEVGVVDRAAASLRLTFSSEGGGIVKKLEKPAQASQQVAFDGSNLGQGSYLLEVELVDRQSGKKLADYPAYRITKVGDDFQKRLVNYISPDNYLVHLGKKRFVWGAYDRFSARFRCRECVSTSEKEYLEIPGLDGKTTLQNYADTRLNAVMNILPFAGIRIEPSRDQLTPWLEALNTMGVGHLQIVNNWMEGSRARPLWARDLSDNDLWLRLADTMRGKPGGIGYYTYDESRPDKIPGVFAQYKVLREHDAGSVDYGVLVNASQVFRWRDVSDALGCDPYPVNNFVNADAVAYGAESPPTMLLTSAWTRAAVSQVFGARPIWMVLQLFRMGRFFPSYDQMKMQAYKAIINGATGIIWWGFVSEKGLEAEVLRENNPQAYSDFQRISNEVMTLEPALLVPPRPDLLRSVSSSQVETLVKLQGDRLFIFASNFLPQSAENVKFTLAPGAALTGAAARVEIYSEARKLALGTEANTMTFTDSFAPYEVHVYILDAARPHGPAGPGPEAAK